MIVVVVVVVVMVVVTVVVRNRMLWLLSRAALWIGGACVEEAERGRPAPSADTVVSLL